MMIVGGLVLLGGVAEIQATELLVLREILPSKAEGALSLDWQKKKLFVVEAPRFTVRDLVEISLVPIREEASKSSVTLSRHEKICGS